jgi:hypothetical protein
MYGTEFSRKPPRRKIKMSDVRFLLLAISLGLVFIGLSYLLIEPSPASPVFIGIGITLAIASQVRVNGNK